MAVLPPPAPDCASCAARDAVIAGQAEAITELRSDVAALAGQVAGLRRRLGRNSGNSSMAPSADDLPGRTTPTPKPERERGGKRKPGGRPGAKGSHLAWSDEPCRVAAGLIAGKAVAGLTSLALRSGREIVRAGSDRVAAPLPAPRNSATAFALSRLAWPTAWVARERQSDLLKRQTVDDEIGIEALT
ncbi:MAG: DUF6444 domain-containing protein [Actinomycetota bacterium]|nr:DUF6444 domain-containing protein [Actinomycetota bacterium]